MTRRPNIEYTVYGDEPDHKGEISRIELIKALNWYNYFHTVKDSRKWILDYMKSKKYTPEQIKKYSSANDSIISQNHCSVARMLTRGAIFENNLDDHIKSIINSKDETKEEVVQTKSYPKDIPNQLIADIDDQLDIFYEKYKNNKFDLDLTKYSRSDISQSIKYYSDLLSEIKSIPDDDSLKEGYRHLKGIKLKRYISFVQGIVDSLQMKVINTKRQIVRKPRKKKVKSGEQLVSKMKYMMHSKELNISSIKPIQITESSTLWVYNEKYKKLTFYCTKNGEAFIVKGSTIQNYDESKSFSKRIRKPEKVIPSILTDPRKKIEKDIGSLKTKIEVPTGRINDQTLLLRTFK
jgi:hypothetical protein